MMKQIFKDKYDYYMNVVYYGLWLINARHGKFMYSSMTNVLYLIRKVFPQEFQKKLCEQKKYNSSEFITFLDGMSIGMAEYWFRIYYIIFTFSFGFIVAVLMTKYHGELEEPMESFVLYTPVAVGYVFLYRAVFLHDRYIEYFKVFQQKDMRWHRKCRLIARGFCLLAIVVFALTLIFAFSIG